MFYSIRHRVYIDAQCQIDDAYVAVCIISDLELLIEGFVISTTYSTYITR